MRGIVFLGDRELEIQRFPDPKPGPREVVVQMKASGMCGSDLNKYRLPSGQMVGDLLTIAGHEPCGVILERGAMVSEEEAPIGQRVMIHHYSGCGQCKLCRSGYSQGCLHGHRVYGNNAPGGHADYILVKPYMLVPLPDELTFAEGAAVSCGTGTAYQALKRLNVSGRDTLAVHGQGPVGLSATLLGTAMGARVLAVDIAPERLAMARELGAAETIDASAGGDPVERIKELTHGEGADASVDCTGLPEPRQNMIRGTRMFGRACFVGEGGETSFHISREIIHKNLEIHGSWTFSSGQQAECAQFVVDRKLPLSRLLTHEFELDEAGDAYRLFDTQTTGKGVFRFD
jgi:threonine dehydrogenase-like Zn-dependent dehydrogenase